MQKLETVKDAIFRLANFSSEEWDFYKNHISEIQFKKKDFLTTVGQIETSAYFIIEGAVKYIAYKDDKEICVDLGFAGNFVSSFASCLAQKASAIAIQAVTSVTAMRLNYLSVFELLERSKNAERFHRRIAEALYIRESNRTYSLISQTAEERYLNLISHQPHALQLIPVKDLASYLGIHPDSLSRIRNNIRL